LAKAWDVLGQDGLAGLLREGWHSVFEARSQILLAADVRAAGQPPEVPGVEWALLTKASPLIDRELGYSKATAQRSEDWLRRGDWCLAGSEAGRIVTYLWVGHVCRDLPGCAWPIGSGRAFIYKTFTRASCRGRGLNRAALARACALLAEGGRTEAFIDVNEANHASVRAIRASGFAEVARFRIVRIGRYRRALVPRRVRDLVTGEPRGTNDGR
jgi:GNAT superfamily N-acetyltransferase